MKNPNTKTFSVKKTLYSTKWYISTDGYRSGFRSFIDYYLDEDARKVHENKIRKEIDESMKISSELIRKMLDEDEYKEIFTQARVGDIYKSYSALTRQSTVIISTLFETFIQEFLTCLLCLYPQRMYNFLILSTENPLKGKIDLKDVLAVSNLSILVLDLAKKAAEQATRGKFRRILSNLMILTKNEVDSSIINKMEPIIEQRNKIVHEFTVDEIDPKIVMNSYSTLIEVIEHIENIAEKIGIETDKVKD